MNIKQTIIRIFSKKKAMEMRKREIEKRNEEMRKYLEDRRINLVNKLKQIDDEYERKASIRRKKHFHLDKKR